MKRKQRLHEEYEAIKSDCALVTASDAKFAPYLFNALNSIRQHFPSHPVIHVFDLGMTFAQRKEIASVPWIKFHQIEHFVPHWKRNWSWKPYLITQVAERFVLYFDSANFVFYRHLELWFLAVRRHGYFVISNGQNMAEITPSDYWNPFGLSHFQFGDVPTFGAGLFGFDSQSHAGVAMREALEYTKKGWTLGRSASETNPFYDGSVVRDCNCFRADQTLLNLSMRKQFGTAMFVRNEHRYCGFGGAIDHPRQFVWYARKRRESLGYFWHPLATRSIYYWHSRTTSYVRIEFVRNARKLRNLYRRVRRSG